MNQSQLNLEVKDSLFDPSLPPNEAKVHVRKKDGREYCKVWVYLEGSDLPYVERVTYALHESFQNPVQTVDRTPSNPNCALSFWTFGAFLVKATILDKKGFSYLVEHQLGYERQFPTEREKYVYEDEEPDTRARPTLVSYSGQS